MDKYSFETGLFISRNFKNRKEAETTKLYRIIKGILLLYKRGSPGEKERALLHMLDLFDPLIRKIVGKLYRMMYGYYEYDDILQEARMMFCSLVHRYNPRKSIFPYYINIMLTQHMARWAKKELTNRQVEVLGSPVDPVFVQAIPIHKYKYSTTDYFDSLLFIDEYIDFVMSRSEKKSKSKTVAIVCQRYFLGNDSCVAIAKDLGLSYHAVYQIIGRIKSDLRKFLCESMYASCIVDERGNIKPKS